MFVYVFRTLSVGGLLRLMASRLFSVNHYYLLHKDLSKPEERQPEQCGQLVKIQDEDVVAIENSLGQLDEIDKKEVLSRLFFYWNGFRNCYLLKSGGEILCMQWIVYPSENHLIKSKYPSKFHPLSSDQIMIENVFTFPRYRGMGYMQHGISELLDLARSSNYTSAVCYIRNDRLPSLNGFTRMGFRIIERMREFRVLGRGSRLSGPDRNPASGSG